jgi:ketol-acid reductoisomerase
MAKCYYDDDADLGVLDGKTVAVVGYGNQGQAQALNLRDAGVTVVVGNRDDEYRELIRADGFEILDIAEASKQADVLMMILPDEVQPEVYAEQIEPNLHDGAAISLAHGYNIYYERIAPRADLDVILVAPKMIGEYVRTHYVDGSGFPSLVAVHQDATGNGLALSLALAKGIGGTRRGAFVSTFEEETVTDLFGEQVGGAGALGSTMLSFETLVNAGFDPDVVALELYASGELADVMKSIVRDGMLDSLRLHSPASRYGQLSRVRRIVPEEAREALTGVLDEIRSGSFASELEAVCDDDYKKIDELTDAYREHPLFQAERRVREATAGRDGAKA